MSYFVKDDFFIQKINYNLAMDIVVKKHYLHRKSPCSFAFGLFKKNSGFFEEDIFGVVVYGTPSSATVRKGICGDSESNNVIELNRLWVDDCVGKNAESFLISNTIKYINKEIILSYADTSKGHIGVVYQASNWIYLGLSEKRTDWKVDGLDLHNQTLSDRFSSDELKQKFGNKFKLIERPLKHRYIYFNCSRSRKKELMQKLRYKIKPYPKNDNNYKF